MSEPFDFSERLALLMSRALPAARRNPDELADIIGELCSALCFAIAIGTVHAPDGPNELIEGIAAQLFEGVAEKAPLAAMIARVA